MFSFGWCQMQVTPWRGRLHTRSLSLGSWGGLAFMEDQIARLMEATDDCLLTSPNRRLLTELVQTFLYKFEARGDRRRSVKKDRRAIPYFNPIELSHLV